MSILCKCGIHSWKNIGKPIYGYHKMTIPEAFITEFFLKDPPYFNRVCVRCGKCDTKLTRTIYERMIWHRKRIKKERYEKQLANSMYNNGCK